MLSSNVGHGLYYVTRDGSPYVRSGKDLPILSAVEDAVLTGLLDVASSTIDEARAADHARRNSKSLPFPVSGPVDTGTGTVLPVGIWYVAVAGRDTYALTGPDAPDLHNPDLAVAEALLVHVQNRLRRVRQSG